MDQAAIVSAFTGGKTGDVFVTSAPYLYVALSRGGKVLANGRSAGVVVPGALVAHPRFARERPELVTRFLRVYLRGIEWQRQNRAAALDILTRSSEQTGVKLDKRWFDEAFKTRPVWGVAGSSGSSRGRRGRRASPIGGSRRSASTSCRPARSRRIRIRSATSPTSP